MCLFCLNCTKFSQLNITKIIKIVATRCQILRLKCTKFDFGWGSAPDPAVSSPDPLAGFKGPTSKGGEGREGRKGKVDVGREEKGGGRGLLLRVGRVLEGKGGGKGRKGGGGRVEGGSVVLLGGIDAPDTHINPQTGPITIHCAAKLSAQCNNFLSIIVTSLHTNHITFVTN